MDKIVVKKVEERIKITISLFKPAVDVLSHG